MSASSPLPEHQDKLKIVSVGDSSVGKSSFLMVLSGLDFPTEFVPTIFDSNIINHVLTDGTNVSICLADASGSDEYDLTRPLAYPGSHVFLLCFSIADPISFERIESKWIQEVRHHSPSTPLVLVGLKGDLRDDSITIQRLKDHGRRIVQREDAQNLAKRLKCLGYLECSALKNDGMTHTREAVVSVALSKLRGTEPKLIVPGGETENEKTCIIS